MWWYKKSNLIYPAKFQAHEKSQLDIKNIVRLITTYPTLIKRPVIDSGDNWLLGYDPEQLNQL